MIDWSRISELREEIGDDDIAEVIEIFLEEVEETISELKSAETDKALEQQFHALKGSALNLGFAEFAEVCRVGEAACAQGDSKAVTSEDAQKSYISSKEIFLAQYDGPVSHP